MKQFTSILIFLFVCFIVSTCVDQPSFINGPDDQHTLAKGGSGLEPTGSNNLSFPVIWAEGVAKSLPGTSGEEPVLEGEWWYWWGTEGTDPNIVPLSCEPNPDNDSLCLNMTLPDYESDLLVKAFVQKDPLNVWQASSIDGSVSPVNVDWIDWGDNLESNDWYLTSKVRTEVVLLKDLGQPATEYQMRHVDGWGIDEQHGLATDLDGNILYGPGNQATIYSNCARLTIQKLNVDKTSLMLDSLEWVSGQGWSDQGLTQDVINPPIFNDAVYDGGDGPADYSAEINVKGRIIYGYTWNVRNLNDGAGVYRITFSFDPSDNGGHTLNTFFMGDTKLLVPLEEVVVTSGETGGGATAFIDRDNNLTYIDVTILSRGSGGKKGGGNGPGGRGR